MNTRAIYFPSLCAKIQTKQFFSGTIQEKLLNLVVKKKLETEIWFKLGALLNKIVRLKIVRCPSNRRFSADNLIWSPRQSDLSAINYTVQRFSTTKLTSISTSGFKTFIFSDTFYLIWFNNMICLCLEWYGNFSTMYFCFIKTCKIFAVISSIIVLPFVLTKSPELLLLIQSKWKK